MTQANDKQVGGTHYRSSIQHWDYVLANDLDYFQAQITKYVTRWKKKGGIADLEKAGHFLEKYIEEQKLLADQQQKKEARRRELGQAAQAYPGIVATTMHKPWPFPSNDQAGTGYVNQDR